MTIQKHRLPAILFVWLALILAFLKDSQRCLAQSAPLARQVEQHYVKGSDLLQKGDLQAAERELKKAITLAPQIPEPYYLLAKVSIARGDWVGAEVLLLKAIQRKPDFAQAHHTLGGIYLQRQDYGLARNAFEQTLRWNPGYPLAHVNLGITLIGLNQSKQAIEHFQTAIKLSPEASPSRLLASYELASFYYRQRDYVRALPYFEQARPLNPSHPELLLSLADVYLKLNRAVEATSVLRETEAIASANSRLHVPLGLLLIENGLYSEGAKQLEAARKSQTSPSFETLYGLGRAYGELKRYLEAVTVLTEALQIRPDHARAYFLQGQAYAQLGDPRAAESLQQAVVLDASQDYAWEALAEQLFQGRASPEVLSSFQGYVKKFPEKPLAHLLLGEAWLHQQRLTEALAQFQQALALDSTLARAHVSLGFVYMELAEPEKARQSFQEALRRDPDHVLANFYLADFLSRSEDIQPALELLNRTIELKPEYPDAYFARGKLYLRRQQFREAVDDLLKVAELRPERAQAHYVLGRAYQGWGKKDKADLAYQRFAELRGKTPGEERR